MADLHAKRMQWLMMRNRQGFAQLFSGHKDTHTTFMVVTLMFVVLLLLQLQRRLLSSTLLLRWKEVEGALTNL